MMQPTEHHDRLSEARRALLEKYLRGEMTRRTTKPVAIPKRSGTGPAPLSYSQQQIWLHSQLAGAHLIYNEPITIHRRGELNISALERSFTEIVRRHEAWRTTFHWNGERCVQIVHNPPTHIAIPFVDLRSRRQAEEEALRLATNDAQQPFDLARGPMFRMRLVCLGDSEHRLFITLHHIIFDGVSLYRVFLPELFALYEAFIKGLPSALPELPIQYSDYAAWQRESVACLAPEHVTYWQTVLHDLPVLELKTDRPRPVMQSYAGAMERFEISATAASSLKALSQEQNATFFMTMTAAFMMLLQKCSGQEDIVVGGISSGRKQEETMGLLGCFLNTIAIRCTFSKEFEFTQVLARVRAATLGALSHDEVPFELLVQELAERRDPTLAPLVQALIVIEPPLDPLPGGWDFTHMDVDTGTAKFDLQLGLDDRANGLHGQFVYNSDLFDHETITNLKSRWLELLEAIASNPTRRVCDLTRASPQVMPRPEWTGKRIDYPRDSSIQELFEEQVRRAPSAVALMFGEKHWSYDQLNRGANQLARPLRKLGVGRDIPVGVWMERSPEMVMALLAILKAGGAYLPLDPSYPKARLEFMIADAGMRVILTHKRLATGAHSAKCLHVDAEAHSDEDDGNLPEKTRAEDLAYIIYTSGSTGVPKGVAIPHRAVVRLVKNTDYASLSADETFLQLAPISFDASTFEIWGPLLNGGRLAVMPATFPTLKEIGRAVHEYGVTTLALTSGLFNAMVDEQLEDLRALQQLLTGGDIISPTHAAKAARALKTVRLINGYGPTESATLACCHTVKTEDLTRRSIPIGKPIANTTVHIFDENLRPVPIGVTGELYVGGDGLARGYWRREQLTAENFIADPFSSDTSARLYKTGDLARWRDDGTIEFLGRADNQIKLRGFRIEPGEIEATLKQQPGVRDSAVVLHKREPGEKQLVGYIVGEASPNELRAALQATLPDYMVPATIVSLPSFPMTFNDKLDRSALPVPDLPAPEAAGDTVRPYLGLQVQLIDICQDLLGVHPIGIRDNFFELGGNSLLALRLLHRAEVLSGKAVLPAVFFSNPTVEFLASELSRQAGEESPPILKVNEQGARTPFFYLHGDLFGGGFYCSRLSRALGPDRPFYVLPPFDVRRSARSPSIKEMAGAHLQMLRSARLNGPYIIGGFCLGGIIAYELAQQIAACGKQVEMLVLIDAQPDDKMLRWARRFFEGLGPWLGWDEERQLNQFRRCWLRREQFRLWRESDAQTQVQLVVRQMKRALGAVGKKMRRKTESTKAAPASAVALSGHRDVLTTFLWAAAGYRAKEYGGPMVTLLSEDLLHRGDHLEDAWRQLAPKASVRSLKGSHLECITAHVDNLAQTINDILAGNTRKARKPAVSSREPAQLVLTD
jgi:amino acid adenylation domain-containing protein